MFIINQIFDSIQKALERIKVSPYYRQLFILAKTYND